MPVETLTYVALAERLQVSPEAARALAKRHRLPRSRSNDGKTLVSVDLAEIQHKPLPARSPGGHRVDAFAMKACIDSLQKELAKVEAMAAGHRVDFEREHDRAERLMAELAKVEATSGGHRADFERERDRAERLMAELLKSTADTMAAREATARLKGELFALRTRPWWKRIAG